MGRSICVAAITLILLHVSAFAQSTSLDPEQAIQPSQPVTNVEVGTPIAIGRNIPALTVVDLEIDVDLGSKISKTAETFPFHLRNPIVIDGMEVVPAGTKGMGEVIHAKKGGGSGAAGELVLAARYLDVGGRQIRLRSLNFQGVGQDKYKTVETINIAAAATVPVASVVGFFITGGEKNVGKGTAAQAKTSEAFSLEPIAGEGNPALAPTPADSAKQLGTASQH